MKELAYAKINPLLDIVGTLPNGYHEVSMLMQSVSLADEIEIVPSDSLQVTMLNSTLLGDKHNLAYKAAVLMAEYLGKEPQVEIRLTKNIFMAAGLAGGSSDAAAVLRGLNRYWDAGLTKEELVKLASRLGSDVPFCLEGGLAWATGTGTELQQLADLPLRYVVLVKPRNIEVSTAWAYQSYDQQPQIDRLPIGEALQRIEAGEGVEELLGNVLERVTLVAHPEIRVLKDKLLSLGASSALMSGSGPTVFGLVESQEQGKLIVDELGQDESLEIALCRTVQRRAI